MKRNLTTWFSILGLLITLVSCEDHRIPAAQRFRVKKVTDKSSSNSAYSFALYNYENNRLVNILTYTVLPNQEPYVFGRTTLYYDEQGRVTKIDNKVDDSTLNPVLNFYYTTAFGYDASNRIATIKKYKVYVYNPNYPFLEEDRQVQYANTQLPSKMVTKINDGSQFDPELDFNEEYVYNGDNIVVIKRTDNPTHYNKYMTYTSTQTFQYDDKINPFYGLIVGVPDVRTLSKNNVIESGKIYAYDANGLLSKVSLRDGSSETTYEYETY